MAVVSLPCKTRKRNPPHVITIYSITWGMKSSQYELYTLGCTRVTIVVTILKLMKIRTEQLLPNGRSPAIRQPKAEIASNRTSARYGELLPKSCTHCPSC